MELGWNEEGKEEGKKENSSEKNQEVGTRNRPENGVKTNGKFFENQADHWMTTKEAAEYLRISAKCLLNLSSNGKVKYFKFGRRNRFLLIDLRKLLMANPKGEAYGN